MSVSLADFFFRTRRFDLVDVGRRSRLWSSWSVPDASLSVQETCAILDYLLSVIAGYMTFIF